MPYQQALDAVSRTENQTINVRIRSPILDDAIDEFTVVSTEARQVKIPRLAEEKSGCGIGKPASHIAEPTMFLLIVVRVHDVRSGLAEVIEHPERFSDRVLQIVVEVDDKLSPGVAETFQHRRMLPEVSRHINKRHWNWHRGNNGLCAGVCIILTSIVYKDEFIASRNGQVAERIEKLYDTAARIVERHDEAQEKVRLIRRHCRLEPSANTINRRAERQMEQPADHEI